MYVRNVSFEVVSHGQHLAATSNIYTNMYWKVTNNHHAKKNADSFKTWILSLNQHPGNEYFYRYF